MPGPVHCMAQSGVWLAIGSGKVVQLIKQGAISSFMSGLVMERFVRFLPTFYYILHIT
jgi:hypothetical protein